MKFKIGEYEYEMEDSPETKEVIGQDDDCQIYAWEVLAEIVDEILKITCIGED